MSTRVDSGISWLRRADIVFRQFDADRPRFFVAMFPCVLLVSWAPGCACSLSPLVGGDASAFRPPWSAAPFYEFLRRLVLELVVVVILVVSLA